MGSPPTVTGNAVNTALMQGDSRKAASYYALDAEIHTADGRVIEGRSDIEQYLSAMLAERSNTQGVISRRVATSNQQPQDYRAREGLWEVSRTVVTWDYTDSDGQRRRVEQLFVRHLNEQTEFIREYTCFVSGATKSWRQAGAITR